MSSATHVRGHHGSRLAVLRRREATRFSSLSDDEVGELQSAIRAERAKASEAIQLRVSVHARSPAILVRARRELA